MAYEIVSKDGSEGSEEKVFHADGLMVLKDYDKTKKTGVWDITSNTLDAENEILSPRGCDWATRFFGGENANPVVLWMHSHNAPIGKAQWIKYNDEGRTVIRSSPRFTDKTEMGRYAIALIEDDIVRAASVGFLPKTRLFGETAKTAYEQDYADLGLKAPDNMQIYSQSWMLYEYSVVSVGSNPAAVQRALSMDFSSEAKSMLALDFYSKFIPDIERQFKAIAEDFKTYKINVDKQLETLAGKMAGIGGGEKPSDTPIAFASENELKRLAEDTVKKVFDYQLGKL